MNGGRVLYIGEHTPWPSYIAVTRERGWPESRKYYQRETCTMAHEDGNDTWWSCNECDADVYLPARPKFCWNCGRKVVDG